MLTLRHKFIGNPHECAFLSFGKNVGSILAYSCGLLNLCRSKEPAFFGAWLRAAHFFVLPRIKTIGRLKMDDQRVTTLLRRIGFRRITNALGDVSRIPCTRLFYDAYMDEECDRETYENEMRELRHRGLLNIDMMGGNEFDRAIVAVTEAGTDWLDAHRE